MKSLPHIIVAVVAALAAWAAQVRGAVPNYTVFQIQARTNFGVNPGGAYNVPPDYFFSGEDIRVNDQRQVAFRLTVTPGLFKSIWFGRAGVGGIVYNTVDDAFIGSVALNQLGRVVWETTFTAQNGLYFYDQPSMTSGFLTNRPLGASSWSSPRINNAGQVGYRVNFSGSGQAWVSWDPAAPNSPAFHVAEVGVDPPSPYSFLFTPNFNNNRQIAGVARRGGPGQTGSSQPDEIRIFNADGSSVLIAQDRDANPASPYSSFDNSPGVNDVGQVAFIATLFAGGRGVFISNGTTTTTIATTGVGSPVSNIEFFSPACNNRSQVVFRAFDSGGRRAIWVGDGVDLKKVVTAQDILPSDLGPARVAQHDSSPVFGGSPSINNYGDVSFNAGLTPPDDNQIEWGSAVYLALVPHPGDLNCDAFVTLADVDAFVLALLDPSAYATAFPGCNLTLADVNGDGFVNGLDVGPFVVLLLTP